MATPQAFPQSRSRKGSAANQLVAILAGPLPELPDAKIAEVTAELRRMRSERAVAIWYHAGWCDLIGWVLQQVPACDPTLAAVHAVRNAGRAATDPDYARCLTAYVRQIARGCSTEVAPAYVEELTWDPPKEPCRGPRVTASLTTEAEQLLRTVGIPVTGQAWEVIAPSIDIAVDWWDALATRSGQVGEDLIVAARQSERTTGSERLRANFDGPAGRPLVALLVGGDQQGRWAREASGSEAGLIYWSLLARRACAAGERPPEPPTPVRRAWATHLAWIQRTLEPEPTAGEAPSSDPTLAA